MLPDQAARVLASDRYHEYRHAACGEGEIRALEAHVGVLKKWRARGLLTIAEPYIESKEAELNELRNPEVQARFGANPELPKAPEGAVSTRTVGPCYFFF